MVDVCINHKSNLFPFLPILPHTMLNTQICALCKNWTVMIMIIRRYCFCLFRIHYRNSVLNVIKCLIIMMGHSVPGLIWMELLRISSESFLCPDELSSSNILPSHDHSNIRKQFYNYISKTLFYRFWIANSTVPLCHRAVRADSQFINNKQLIMNGSVFQLSGWIV